MPKTLGRYEVLCELGHGAMGAVFQARDPLIDRVVAIKTIAVHLAAGEDRELYFKRFVREAQAAGKLAAPGIVSIFDIGQDPETETPFIVMEYVAGRTLERMVASAPAGRLPLDVVLDLLQQVATALDYAHAQNIVHRDIKPANILVTEDGRAKIADFGIAKVAFGEATMPGQVLGTPAYMSPEQLSGKPVDGRSDIFSLGVMAYWLLTGEKPFAADSATSLAFQVVYKDPRPAAEINSSLAPEYDYVLRRMLAKDPVQRYQRARDCAADLEDLRNGKSPRSLCGATVERTAVEDRTVIGAGTAAAAPARALETEALEVLSIEPTPPAATVSKVAPPPSMLLRFRSLPPKQRWIFVGIAALLILAAVVLPFLLRSSSSLIHTGSATLRLSGQHSFRSAQLSVWIDDDLAYSDKLAGTVRKHSSLFGSTYSTSGNVDVSLRVPEGRHKITVKISALDQNYLQTKSITEEFAKDSTRTLHLGFGRSGKELNLDWE